MRVQNINITVLKEAADMLDEPSISQFPKLKEWIEGSLFPTFNQLEKLAKVAKIPFGYFFLEELPQKAYPIPHYRTISNNTFRPSKELFETIEAVQEKQEWARDLLIDLGAEPLPFAGRFTTNSSIEDTAIAISEILGLHGLWANNLMRWSDSLRVLIERTEKAGIFVVVNGVVNNNTHRPLNVKEFRGFVLYNEMAPFIFINGKDAISGRIFTLVHEIVHVLVGSTASFDLQQLIAADNRIEQFCNKVAAEFLVPKRHILKHLEGVDKIDYNQLAKVFKVSQIVIARRLLDLKIITRDEYFEFYDLHIKRERIPKGSKGGDFYNTAPYKISRRFFNLVDAAAKQNKILYRDAFRLTGLKPKTYDTYLEKQHG